MPSRNALNYDVIGQIGAGGMAVVYKAIQRSLNRTVAIKELKPSFMNDSQVVARFLREATALAALQHQNIIHIYDFFQDDNTLRIMMEYVEGIDCFDLLEHVGHVPADVGMVIGLEICRALEYAHYRGIIHRDIKPSNIIISRKGEVKLMDFGIARDQNLGDLTRPGTSLGTPAYMSPEQIMGVDIDFRSDIFSFGIVLYQMLTGRKPFVDDAKTSIMHQILKAEFTRPRKVNLNIPKSIETIILTCMSKEAKDRYETTGVLRSEIEAYLSSRVRMNHSGRLVVYLQHKQIVERDEAVMYVPPAMLIDKQMLRHDEDLPPPLDLKRVGLVQGILGVVLLVWILGVHFISGLTQRTAAVELLTGPDGALKVVAWPWADIYIDGQYVETTPVARTFPLAPGVHEVTLKNPNCQPSSHKVRVEPAKVQKLYVKLSKRDNP